MPSQDPYEKLREFLDQLPLGYPRTESGVELKILKKLFTEAEAELAALLIPVPEEARQISERCGVSLPGLEEKLESMSRKGLIFRVHRQGKTLYNTAPFMIGLYEYSVDKMDRELAELCRQYYEEAYQTEMGASNIPGFKVIPVTQRVDADLVLFPFEKLKEEVRAARKIAVAECVCRKETRLLDHGCDYPRETCLSFGTAAEYYIENGMGREITAEEAIKILEETDQAGLVHAGANTRHLANICNCCPCCCASMKGMVTKGHQKEKYMNALYEAVIDRESCLACEECSTRCPVQAIVIEDSAVVNRDKCLGCGLCAGVCPSEAITLHLRKDRQEPFKNTFEMGLAILKGKKENLAKKNNGPSLGS
ncbi:MAG: 4Fe-4S binding protein [Deltaproteobacteria bacterium]|nr:4Fe-4S binding protein [Deltaproteobacteria bacterium]